MSIRHEMITVPASQLFIDVDANFRERDGYDLESLITQIKSAGEIIEPLHVECQLDGNGKPDLTKLMNVLRGNRRGLSAQKMDKDPSCPANVKASLQNIRVIPYSGFTPEEKTAFMLDHGGQKPLGKVEIVKACWRLHAMMYSEKDIMNATYTMLAVFTGNFDKQRKIEALPAGSSERDDALKDWLRGTLSNYILYARKLGRYMQEQFLLTVRETERTLTEEEKAKWELDCSRKAMTKLWSAKTKDEDKKSGGAGWNPETGGENYNALLAQLKKEFKDGTTNTGRGKSRPDAEKLKELGNSCTSDMRLVYLQAAGELEDQDKARLLQADAELTRWSDVRAVLYANVERITEPALRELVSGICSAGADNVSKLLAPFFVKVTEPTKGAETETTTGSDATGSGADATAADKTDKAGNGSSGRKKRTAQS